MSTPSTELENRLAEALTARADQVGPADLRPAFAPRPVPPWWSRVRPAYVGGGVLVAAAAAVVAVAVIGNGDDRAQPEPPPASNSVATDPATPEPTASTPPDLTTAPLPGDLLPEDRLAFSDDAEPVSYADGSTATVTATAAGTYLEIEIDGDTYETALPAPAEGGAADTQLQLGQAGVGYLVAQSAGEFNGWSVVVLRDDTIVVAEPSGDVPLGMEFIEGTGVVSQSWTTGDGAALYTRVAVTPGAPDDAFRVYRWDVTGPGEGGGADVSDVTLEPTDLGVVCIDAEAGTYERCEVDGAATTAGDLDLLPEDNPRGTGPGEDHTFPDGSRAGLVATGGGFELSVTQDGETQQVPVPDVTDPVVLQQQVTLAGAVGYLVSDEGGDSTALTLFVVRDGDLVEVEERGGDVRFGGGLDEDGSSYRTYVAGGGQAIYTEVRANFQDTAFEVFGWSLDPETGALVPASLGTVS